MINLGKCSKCEKQLTHVHFEAVSIRQAFGVSGWKGVSYLCPNCKSILGVQIDPIAIRTEIVDQVVAELRK